MNILLSKMMLWLASILPQEVFMSDSFPKLYKVELTRFKTNSGILFMKRRQYPQQWSPLCCGG